jgi:hypothetical protein
MGFEILKLNQPYSKTVKGNKGKTPVKGSKSPATKSPASGSKSPAPAKKTPESRGRSEAAASTGKGKSSARDRSKTPAKQPKSEKKEKPKASSTGKESLNYPHVDHSFVPLLTKISSRTFTASTEKKDESDAASDVAPSATEAPLTTPPPNYSTVSKNLHMPKFASYLVVSFFGFLAQIILIWIETTKGNKMNKLDAFYGMVISDMTFLSFRAIVEFFVYITIFQFIQFTSIFRVAS